MPPECPPALSLHCLASGMDAFCRLQRCGEPAGVLHLGQRCAGQEEEDKKRQDKKRQDVFPFCPKEKDAIMGWARGCPLLWTAFLALLMSGGCLQKAVRCSVHSLCKELASGQSMTYNCHHK